MKTNIKKKENTPVEHLQDGPSENLPNEAVNEESPDKDGDISDLDADILMYMIHI